MADVDLETIKARLTNLELKLNSEESRRIHALEDEQLKRFPILEDLSEGGEVYKQLKRILDGITQRYLISYTPILADRKLEENLTALFQYSFRFPKVYYKIKDKILPDVRDEENLEKTAGLSLWSDYAVSERLSELLDDVLMCLGKLAKNIKSTALSRIVTLAAKCATFGELPLANNEEDARGLAKEFLECVRIVNAELRIMEPEEQRGVHPSAPVHEYEEEDEEFDADQFSPNTDPDDATAAAREFAVEQYEKKFADLLPKKGAGKNEKHRFQYLSDFIRSIADEMEKGEPSVDTHWSRLDTSLLSRVLATDFDLTYESYEREDVDSDDGKYYVRLTHDTCWEETAESRLKKLIVDDLQRYLNASARVAQAVGSPSLSDWSRLLTLMGKHGGHFRGYFFDSEVSVAMDLREFVNTLARARDRIFGDVKAAGGVKPLVKDEDTSIKVGPYASKFVLLCDPGKGVFRVKDEKGVETEYRLSVKAKKVWETLCQLVSTKSVDGFVKLPQKWEARFKATIGSTSEIDPDNDINIVRYYIFRESPKKGRGGTGRFRLMPTPEAGKIKELLKLRKRTKTLVAK